MSNNNNAKNSKKSAGMDMTTGNPTRLIIYFALLFVMGNIL